MYGLRASEVGRFAATAPFVADGEFEEPRKAGTANTGNAFTSPPEGTTAGRLWTLF
jgi:hypothetical protein